MGLPIKHRKKFVSHKKRWDKNTITEEAVLVSDYALKNKKEIRKVELSLSKYKNIAKEFNKTSVTKASEEAKHFVEKLKALGFLSQSATSLDEVLDIELRDILERRLCNVIYKKKLARTPRQARQFIVHKHVKVNGKLIDSPSHLVTLAEEENIEFAQKSSLADEEHPERKMVVETVEVETAEVKSEETTTEEVVEKKTEEKAE